MANKEYRINVYDNEGPDQEVVSRVRYNQDLDYWNGSNWQNGGTGRHLGITKLKTGEYVLIYGTNWQGERDYGLTCDSMDALQAILKSGHAELLETKRFKDLKAFAIERKMIGDTEETE